MAPSVHLADADRRAGGTCQPVRYAKAIHWGKPGATWTACHPNPGGQRVKRNEAVPGAAVTCRKCLAYLEAYPNLPWLAAVVADGAGRSSP